MQHHHHDSTINSQLCIQVISTFNISPVGKDQIEKSCQKNSNKNTDSETQQCPLPYLCTSVPPAFPISPVGNADWGKLPVDLPPVPPAPLWVGPLGNRHGHHVGQCNTVSHARAHKHHTHTHIYIHTYLLAHTSTHTYAHTHTHTHTHTRTHTHNHSYTHTYCRPDHWGMEMCIML